jgi:HEAT repeat protein
MSRIACLVLALVALGGCGTKPKSVPDLIGLLQAPEAPVQSEAAYELSLRGPEALPALPALIEALKSQSLPVRQNAALAIGKIGAEAREAVPALIQALGDPEYSVRKEAADALGGIGPEAQAAIPALEKFSRERDPCKAASGALAKIKP